MILATIVGNLGADCEEVVLGNTPAIKFRMGSTRSRKDKDGQKKTDWVTVISFRKGLEQYLTKGTKVLVVGELEADPWSNQQGVMQAGLRVVADRIEFVGGQQQQGQGYQQAPAQYQQPAQPFPPVQEPTPQQPVYYPQQGPAQGELPF